MRKRRKWSKEKIIAEIRAFRKSGRPLNSTIIIREHHHHWKLHSAAKRYFGSWKEAVEEAGFDYNEVVKVFRKWSKEKIIAEISRLNEAGEWLSYKDVQRSHSALIGAAEKYFGGWGRAVKAAGFPYELIKKMRQKERSLISHRGTMKWSEEKVITQIRLFYKFKKTLQPKKVAETNIRLIAAGCKYFGSWRNAVEAAGFDYDQFLAKHRWTKEKVISQIQAFYKAKKTLKYKEVCREGKELYSAASKRFGNWRKAVAAAGFDYEELFLRKEREEKKEKVISEIRAYYKANGTLQYKKVCKLNRPLVTAAFIYFGSWRNAVEAAGFDYDQFLARKEWTKDKMISEIQAFYRVKGTLQDKEVRRGNKSLLCATVRCFGSWRNAVEAAGFDYKQFLDREQWTRAKIIAEIKALYYKKKTLQYSEVYQANKRLCSAASKHFGGWRKAVEAAGFDYDQFLPRRKWTKEKVVSGIKAFYRAKGTLQYREVFRKDNKLYFAACKYFGNWRNAVEAAGFDYNQFLPQRKWTKERIISEIKAYHHTKKTLQSKVVYGDNKKLCSAACKYFGSWRNAVEAAGFNYDQFRGGKG